MGISGLLPVLKSIQVRKHLSDFAGQTLAVDAYVWLHRGVFTCATELATGRNTSKYVDYAMHRIRLLRHHQIQPYVVFDGGPLPAKKGTEIERKQKRKENLARGNTLASQGKHSQAREYYVKCIDVTPQMAFQFIKALRAESIPYVVAPYEADAQLAYLERIGLVDGIITEDSDLLVFGCRTVLFKLDAVASTIISISRTDFASVTASESDSNGISLIGWSDLQFRSMAILSGCDYLPSISGIGLKTACSLLRKWKTVENVIRAITMEGKKNVPKGYLRKFRLAEKCFLHQRVYDPVQERLVYLMDIDDEWDSETEAYVGGDIEASMAKAIALGDADPVTLLPMEDVNPRFVPRSLKPLPLSSSLSSLNQKDKGKGKAPAKSASEGILSFFGPKAKILPTTKQSSSQPLNVKSGMVVGRASGKRTLADVMDQDLAVKKKKREDTDLLKLTQSRFFGPPLSPKAMTTHRAGTGSRNYEAESTTLAGPSCIGNDKENAYIVIDDGNDDVDMDTDMEIDFHWDISMEVQGDVDAEMEIDVEEPLERDPVEQEDGYISPSPSCSRDTQELSSPPRPGTTPTRKRHTATNADNLDFGADVISSPPPETTVQSNSLSNSRIRSRSLTPSSSCGSFGQSLVWPMRDQSNAAKSEFLGPDLRNSFGDDLTSEIDCFEDEGQNASGSTTTPTSSPSTPVTPDENSAQLDGMADRAVVVDPEELEARATEMRNEAVASGWRDKWALSGKSKEVNALRRRETTMTPAGRRFAISAKSRPRPYHGAPRSAPSKAVVKPILKPKQVHTRKSLAFSEKMRQKTGRENVADRGNDGGDISKRMTVVSGLDFDAADEVLSRVQDRLARFRCP